MASPTVERPDTPRATVLRLLEALKVPQNAQRARDDVIAAHVTGQAATDGDPNRLVRDAMLAERLALQLYRESVNRTRDDETVVQAKAWFERTASFWCYAARWQNQPMRHLLDQYRPSPHEGMLVSERHELALRLAVAGLVAEKSARVRLELSELIPDLRNPRPLIPEADWGSRVILDVVVSFLLLVRKSDGWADIDAAMRLLAGLRSDQANLEAEFLQNEEQRHREEPAAWRLLGSYHLAQILTLTGDYLQGTQDLAIGGLTSRIDRHRDRANEALQMAGDPLLAHYSELLWVGCRELVNASLWTHISAVGGSVAEFARSLADRTASHPVLELWPGQQEALRSRLLDPYPRAVIVQMPTSGGKTLVAEFSIVQTHALQPGSTVVYVAPTRALVNQVCSSLRSSLRRLGLTVEMTVPAFELDPTEDQLLHGHIDVLVTTPEKFDFLLRNEHASVSSVSMVVVDEAHHLSDEQRGARLELVLATVRRDRPNARFLLLSPFLSNAAQLVSWLAGARGAAPILVDWRPSAKVVGLVSVDGRRRRVLFEALDATDNCDIRAGVQLTLGAAPGAASSNKEVTRFAVSALKQRGTTLVLCRGIKDSMDRALEVLEDSPAIDGNRLLDVSLRYVDSELGVDNALSRVMRHGVAFHHSGLSLETRWLVERLISRNIIHTVCGTSTLAQGVNFPISNVLVESVRKGQEGNMSYAEFWNVAGRAGRTLVDCVGVVGFPVTQKAQKQRCQQYMTGHAEAVSSQLADIVTQIDDLGAKIGLAELRRIRGLSDMLQFLAHAMRVAGADVVAEELEDLLRGSLVYHQQQILDPGRAARLVRLCRAYVDDISGNPGIAVLSDRTGFATPSVGMLMHRLAEEPLITHADWDPDRLFGSDCEPLARRVQLISDVPEITLGRDTPGVFSAEKVARILRDWVSGSSVVDLAARYPMPATRDHSRGVVDFSRYLFGKLLVNASWGLGALRSVHGVADESTAGDLSRYVPSMVYFGVRTKEQIWARMAGVPRGIADAAAALWVDETSGSSPSSYGEIRDFVGSVSREQWARHMRSGPLRPDDVPVLWNELLNP